MRTLWAVLRLTRLDSSLVGFLAIFLPFLARTDDISLSLSQATPLLFICMCAFIANDLDDQERDEVNHPDRPLPARRLNPTVAAGLYFVCLGSALFSTRYWVEPRIAFWYYALVTLSISYSYIVEWVPGVKAPYVAAATSLPVLIVAASYPDEPGLRLIAGATFLLVLGREVCMDIADRAGDAVSFMNRFGAIPLAICAFSLQATGLLILATQSRRLGQIATLLLMASALVLSGIYWFELASRKKSIILMKLQLFAGLYFLLT